jgi:hypothetical protein
MTAAGRCPCQLDVLVFGHLAQDCPLAGGGWPPAPNYTHYPCGYCAAVMRMRMREQPSPLAFAQAARESAAVREFPRVLTGARS